jgi:hypothetical protein
MATGGGRSVGYSGILLGGYFPRADHSGLSALTVAKQDMQTLPVGLSGSRQKPSRSLGSAAIKGGGSESLDPLNLIDEDMSPLLIWRDRLALDLSKDLSILREMSPSIRPPQMR